MHTLFILETLKKSACTTDTLLLLSIGKYLPIKKIKTNYLSRYERQYLHTTKNNLYNLLYKLQQKGYVTKKINNQRQYWILTPKGKIKMSSIKSKRSLPSINYINDKDKKFKIIVFDIPEQYKNERNWLRRALTLLGFSMLQKSVWCGYNKIPPQFKKDIEDLNINKFIQFFEFKHKLN
ncbi:MAG: hypothetical protein ACP5IC_01030 [Minisyncoccia bacterium]